MSNNVVLLLPPFINVNELPILFNSIGDKYYLFRNHFSIEIEYIYVNKNIKNIVVYFGEINKVLFYY